MASKEEYIAQLENDYDWEDMREEAMAAGLQRIDPDGDLGYSALLGTVLDMWPSHKIYAVWSDGITDEERENDHNFTQALEDVVEKHGATWFQSEHDPNDVFVVWPEQQRTLFTKEFLLNAIKVAKANQEQESAILQVLGIDQKHVRDTACFLSRDISVHVADGMMIGMLAAIVTLHLHHDLTFRGTSSEYKDE